MRKVFLDDLPRRKQRIDWMASIGHKVKFIYDDIEGEIKILEYNKEKFKIMYNDAVFENIYLAQFKNGALGKVVGKINSDHIYNIGDIINEYKIVEKIKIKRNLRNSYEKGYVVVCRNCGYKTEKLESELKRGIGCPVCGIISKKVIKGINDIGTLRPDLASYFVNDDDKYKYSICSGKKVLMRCPICNMTKMYPISDLNQYGELKCICGDGSSYPNKFMFNTLCQLDIDFVTEYTPKWANGKRYDFYVPSKNLIIEMDGSFHYVDNDMSGQTKEESRLVDDWKEFVAKENGLVVVRIDCAYFNNDRFKYVRNNIITNKELNKHINLSNVIWEDADRFALSNRVKEICDLWSSGKFNTTSEISIQAKISQSAVQKYLKKGSELGWCDYDPKREAIKSNLLNAKNRRKSVDVYKNGAYIMRFCGIRPLIAKSKDILGVHIPSSGVYSCLKGEIDNYNGFSFKYVED